jgi:hypothetical protein
LDARQDRATAEVVAQGIAMAGHSGRKNAAAFLNTMGVAFPVIVRVLDENEAKRPDPAR